MCDYSLQNVASRPAAVGDKLVTSKFPNALSAGFGPADEHLLGQCTTAVCVLPGTELAFDDDVQEVNYGEPVIHPKVAIFRQTDTELTHTHHDTLEFADGSQVKLARLLIGQTATVLQLPAAPKTAEEAKAQTRLAVVG